MSTSITFQILEERDGFTPEVDKTIGFAVLKLYCEYPNGNVCVIFHREEEWNKFLDVMKPHVIERDAREIVQKELIDPDIEYREKLAKQLIVEDENNTEEALADSHGYHYEDPNR